MQTTAIQNNRKRLILFSIMLAALMGLVFILASSLSSNTKASSDNSNVVLLSQTNKLINSNEKLQQQLTALHQLDQQYANAITGANFVQQSDSLNKLILLAENNFRSAVSTAGQESTLLTDENIKQHYEKMLAAFRSLIDNRKAISSLRNVVAVQSNNLAPDEKAMLNMQDELMEKNNTIASLETTVKTMERTKAPVMVKPDDSKWQQQISELENKVSELNNTNGTLQQTNEKLVKQQTDASKNMTSAEQALKEKNMNLQQKVDDLNAEIQLVKVDCNLNRVDATQIISNAKQRKVLLNEASGILTNLSFSSNADINKKVKEKIVRLNQVAANTRE